MSFNDAEISLSDVAEALRFLDSGDRDLWIRMGMAIKREFGEAGFDVWDQWSANYKKYKTKEAASAWKSFKFAGVKGTATIGSLIYLAQEKGFKFDRPELTQEQKAKLDAEHEARRIEREKLEAQEIENTKRWHSVVAEFSQGFVSKLSLSGESPYLGKKKVRAFGIYFAPHAFVIRTNENFTIDLFEGAEQVQKFFSEKRDGDSFVYFKRGTILIPLYDFQGTLQNLQIIFNDGKKKRFLTHGRKSGLFCVLGEMDEPSPLVFCEGYATGASVHMATGWPTVVCFDAGNLPVVTEQFNYAQSDFLVAGDNDHETFANTGKNPGLSAAKDAAKKCGGFYTIPRFSGDATGLSDFNDLYISEGAHVVKAQLEDALAQEKPAPEFESTEAPPNFEDIPPPDYSDYADYSPVESSSPEPTRTAETISLEILLQRYALTDPDSKVWDSLQKKLIKIGSFKNLVRPKLYKEWLEHENRRTVLTDDVIGEVYRQQKKGRGGLADALRRYVYLNPSDTVWDRQTREVVAVSHLKIAIADCYTAWVTHPEREEMPVRNLVFDPTQRVSAKDHINLFRGLAISPKRDPSRCERIVEMLMMLCNNDLEVFRWLRRWLAYPLINVGAKMETAVLCHSDVHGSGKSYFFDVVMRAIYGEYSRTVGQAQLEGQYNDWMSKVLYCVYEEVLSRAQRYSHQGTIKQTITGKTVRIEKKFMSGWEEANHMNSVFLSNEVMPLPVEPADRRFLVLWPEKTLYERLQRGVDQDLANGGAEAFYQFLLDTPMQSDTEEYQFDAHTKPPMTEAKARLIEHGRAIWEVFFNEWQSGDLKHGDLSVPYCSVRVYDLFSIFQAWCTRNRENAMGAHKFSSFISSKLRKRKDLFYDFLSCQGRGTFYIVGAKPDDKSQEQWLGACVHEFQRILQSSESDSSRAANNVGMP